MSSVELYHQPLPDWLPPRERADWLEDVRMANMLAATQIVPRGYRKNPPAIFAVFQEARRLGMKPGLGHLKKWDVIDGAVEPRALTLFGLMLAAGHYAKWGTTDDTVAELYARRKGDDELQLFRYTIDEARTAGRLDTWVETAIPTGEHYEDGNPVKEKVRFVIGQADVEPPEWAAKAIAEGRIHRLDAWHTYAADMLVKTVAKRAAKRIAPEIDLGLGEDDGGGGVPVPAGAAGLLPPAPAAPADSPTPTVPRTGQPAADEEDKAELLRRTEALKHRDAAAHAALQRLWTDPVDGLGGGNVKHFSRIEAIALAKLLDDVEARDAANDPTRPF